MPHVSNKKLKDDDQEALYKEFIQSLERCFDRRKSLVVLSRFLTHTEKEMFAKRFAVIAMLSRSIAPAIISQTLKMSPTTIETMNARYQAGKYDWVVKTALKKNTIWELLDDLTENLNTAGGFLPPKIGRGRYKRI